MARDDPKRRRTPPERSGTALCPRDAAGRLRPIDALQRFASKCWFDGATGCVIWEGGKTRGRGNTAQYGSFWYEGARWFAHRWAGVHIHGLNLDGVQAGHCCPCGPNTLCVEHVTGQSLAENVTERNVRVAAARRKVEQLPPEPERDPEDIPFYTPPEWLRPFLAQPEEPDECPF